MCEPVSINLPCIREWRYRCCNYAAEFQLLAPYENFDGITDTMSYTICSTISIYISNNL